MSSNPNERFGFGLLRKKQPKQKRQGRNETNEDGSESSDGYSDLDADYVSSSNLNLPSFRPSGKSTDDLRGSGSRGPSRNLSPSESGQGHLKTEDLNQRRQMIEDDAIATIRDNSGADRCFDDVDDTESEASAHGSAASPVSSPSRSKRLQFKSCPSIIPEEVVAPDEKDYTYEEKDNDDKTPMHEQDDTVSTQSSETKMDHFRNLFRRRSTIRGPSSETRPRRSSTARRGSIGMRNLSGGMEDDEANEGFLQKFLNMTGGGLVPGVTGGEAPAEDDHERVSGQQNLEDPLPMEDIDAAAQQIVQAHSNMAKRNASVSQGISGGSYSVAGHADPGSPQRPTNGAERYQDPESIDPHDPITRKVSNSSDPLATPHGAVSPFDQSADGATMVSSDHNDAFYVPAMGHYDDIDDQEDMEPLMVEGSYIAPANRVRGGVLGSLLKLYQNPDDMASKSQVSLNESSIEQTPDPGDQNDASGAASKKNFNPFHKKTKSQTTLADGEKPSADNNLPNFKATRPKPKMKAAKFKKKQATEARITVHIADLLQRQRFILRLCKALMLYGAPTHRLEEYMVMTSRVLEIDGQFLYVPGCMIISFGDMTTRTSEVQLVRCNQGLNLWKLHGVHSVYKQVVHDIMSVEDANIEIDRILNGKNLYPPWVSVFLYGFCSSMVTPFAFGGDWVNMAVAFGIGLCVGLLQFIVSQKSNLYSNVFEITASIVVSFCGRALGSIPNSNICFGASVQGSLALILPGYIILCGSLELQSRNLVAGAVRMFYAIIYSLFLGFGITLGAALFGWLYHGASNETTCAKSISPWYRFIFVPCFSIGLGLINQARWSQLPVMTFISCCGYVVTYFSGKHFANSTEFTSSLAAFVIGIMGNLYSRIWKGFAVSAILPAIFVQVPSGVASQSSLLAGVQSANAIVHNGTTTVVQNTGSSTSFGITMIQVSIGISVGLFASTLFVYPFGKKRTVLFTL